VSEVSDLGSAPLAFRGREDRRGGGTRTVVERQDGRVVYIEETIHAGVLVARAPSVVERWRDVGLIGEPEHQAALRLATDWRLMHLPVRYSTASLVRVDRSGSGDEAEWRAARARAEARWRHIAPIIGPMLSCLLPLFLAEEVSLTEIARTWTTTVDDVRGRVIAGLAVLAAQYGH